MAREGDRAAVRVALRPTDHVPLAQKLGFADQFLGKKDGKQQLRLDKTAKGYEEPNIEDVLTYEINGGSWTIGYTGQSPRRLQAHMRNMHRRRELLPRGQGRQDRLRPDRRLLRCRGVLRQRGAEASRLAEPLPDLAERHGRRRELRANFGVERDGVSLLAEDGSASKGADLQFGYPEFDHVLLKKLGWWDELTEPKKEAEGKNWKTDLSGGIQRVVLKNAFCLEGNAKARAVVCTSPTACRSTASRCTRRGRTSSRSIRPTTM